jgi:hypothetical protein
MSDPLQLIRQTQAENQYRYAEQQDRQQRIDQQRSKSYTYQGYNAESGQSIISNGDDSINVNGSNTNGLIKPNQSVKYLQSGNQNTIDQMPRPKRTEDQTTSSVSGKIKVLFTIAESNSLSVYVGGWKSSPVKLATYQNQGIGTPYLNNLGGDRFIVSWLLVDSNGTPIDVVVKTNAGGWTLKELHPDTDIASLFRASDGRYLGKNLGFGVWRFETLGVQVGSPPDVTSNSIRGIWYRDILRSADYLDRVTTTDQYEDSLSEGTIFLLPSRAESVSISSRIPGSGADQSAFYRNVLTSNAFLVNSPLTRSYGYRNHTTQTSANGRQLQIQGDSGLFLFKQLTEQMLLPGVFDDNDFRQLTDNSAVNSLVSVNWVGEKLLSVPAFLDGTTLNFAFDQPAKFKSTIEVTVVESEFAPVVEIEGFQIPESRRFKAKIYPLKSGLNPDKTAIFAASYHPN